nr:rubredoxin [Gordonia malaquae]
MLDRPAATAYRCPNCEYVYREAEGAPREGYAAGTPWASVPDDWNCPDCGVRDKIDFLPIGA